MACFMLLTPSCAHSFVMAAPIPMAPPVIKTIFFSKFRSIENTYRGASYLPGCTTECHAKCISELGRCSGRQVYVQPVGTLVKLQCGITAQ